MVRLRPSLRDGIIASGYFGLAALAAAFTRFDGGVAFIWTSTALLIAELIRRRRSTWPVIMALCGIAGALATGWFGLGWALALPFALFNLAEAGVGAWLLTRWRSDRRAFESLGWMTNFILSVGIAAPLAMGISGALWLTIDGRPFGQSFLNLFVGHSLGSLSFVPFFMLLLSGRISQRLGALSARRATETVLLLAMVAVTVTASFAQSTLPLLFLPAGPIILAVFRGGEVAAAGSMVLLGLIGGIMTGLGHGPIELMDVSPGAGMHFFQFYLAAAVLTILPITSDLRKRRQLYRQLRMSEARYRLLADFSTDIILHMRPDGRILYASPSITQLGGYSPAEVEGRMILDLVPEESRRAVIEGYRATAAAEGRTHTYRHLALLADKSVRWFESHSRALSTDRGGIEGIISVVRDISEQVSSEVKMENAAMTDSLTGLLNRRAFHMRADALEQEKATAMVALFDIDHFKQVNDRFGHDAGDEVLKAFAKIAMATVRRGDAVGRLGGEEFALLLTGVTHAEALATCDRLRREFAANVQVTEKGLIQVTISGGLAPLGDLGIDAALRLADKALYEAKNGGRDQLALAA